MITSLATGGVIDDSTYRVLRSELIEDPTTGRLLPTFVRSNVDSAGLWAYFKDVHAGSGAYAARRQHINAQFQPLLDHLLSGFGPADVEVAAVVANYDAPGITEAWNKALNRRQSDPEGAITVARTLLEEVCKHILDDAGEAYDEKADLPKLYASTAALMNLAPSQHTERAFKQILGSCQAIVETLGSIRNKISDAHGGGRKRTRPSSRHAALAVPCGNNGHVFDRNVGRAKEGF